MEFLKFALLGVGFGVTENLPISSCGHMLLFKHIFGQNENLFVSHAFLYIGVLIAIVGIYYKLIWNLLKAFFRIFADIFKREFSFSSCDRLQNMFLALGIGAIPLLFLFVPVHGSGTNILGIIREFSEGNNVVLAGISFLINGVLLKFGINNLKSDKYKYTYKTPDNVTRRWEGRKKFTVMDAVWCGTLHLASMIFPGISHIGAVFSIAVIRGLNKKLALDYSFLIGIPLLFIMLFSELSYSLRFIEFSSFNICLYLAGSACCLIFSFLFIKIFNKLVEENKISVFAFYSFILGIGLITIGIFEKIKGINLFQGTVL